MTDLLFCTHNRLEFSRASLDALLHNTDWKLVNRLLLIDDASTDGTLEFLQNAARIAPVHTKLVSRKFGGPVAAMLQAVELSDADMLAKIDNDLIVCPGWLNAMLAVMRSHPRLDALGMEPGFGGHVAPIDRPRTVRQARWIGGIGLIRTRVFQRRRPVPKDRFFGLTEFWRRQARTGWISPDIPVFLLDHLPVEPWESLASLYVKRGWSRAWPKYEPHMKPYWDWWTKTAVAASTS